MSEIVFNLTTALLMLLMVNCGRALNGPGSIRERRIPWVAVGLTLIVVAGVVLQMSWGGAMDALDDDPARSGWWRVLTSVFMQNGGVAGTAWNIVTLAAVAALAQWYWGGTLTLVLFAAGIFLPRHIDVLFGITGGDTDPRNFAGSSGVTYFLAATLAVPLLLRARQAKERLIALAIPALGLAMFFVQNNWHGLVATYGWVLGALVWVLRPKRLVPAS